MRHLLALSLVIACSALAGRAYGDLVAYWSFNQLSIGTANTPAALGLTSIAANSGSGTLSLANFAGNVDDFGGSTLNAYNAAPAGVSLSLITGGPTNGPYPGNGGSFVLQFSLTGLENPVLTYAGQRTATGFNSDQLAWSTDGTIYTDFGTAVTLPASYAVQTVDLSSINALDNASTVYLRMMLAGGASNNGNNRFDNIQINATTAAVPEASTILFGALVCMTLGVTYCKRKYFDAQVPEA